eukprot:353311-Chlamydomonas_euryale.AAC.4
MSTPKRMGSNTNWGCRTQLECTTPWNSGGMVWGTDVASWLGRGTRVESWLGRGTSVGSWLGKGNSVESWLGKGASAVIHTGN